MIEIKRLISIGDNVSLCINGTMRTGVVKAATPMRSIVIDCSTNALQPKPEKFFWVGGVDGWITEEAYNNLGKPSA